MRCCLNYFSPSQIPRERSDQTKTWTASQMIHWFRPPQLQGTQVLFIIGTASDGDSVMHLLSGREKFWTVFTVPLSTRIQLCMGSRVSFWVPGASLCNLFLVKELSAGNQSKDLVAIAIGYFAHNLYMVPGLYFQLFNVDHFNCRGGCNALPLPAVRCVDHFNSRGDATPFSLKMFPSTWEWEEHWGRV